MRVRYDDLCKFLRESLMVETEEITLSDGSQVPYGSSAHIRDWQTVLVGLENLRSQQKRASAARHDFARAHSRLQIMVKRAERDTTPLDHDARTFSQLENDAPQFDGRTGYGANGEGTFGAGQYAPGFEDKSQ